MAKENINKEIDVVALMLKVLKEWKTLLKFLSATAVLGIVVAFATPKEFTSEVILAPEISSGGLGLSDNLADLASNFGFDLGQKSSMDAIYPELYPDVFSSTDFVLELFNVTVRTKDDNTTKTYLEHLLKDTKEPFWNYPKLWITKMLEKPETPGKGKNVKDPYRLSKIDSDICKGLSSVINCLVDKRTSEITISVTDQDPLVAAIMADTLQLRLQNYITKYRTKKARIDYEYYKKLMTEAKARYEKTQQLYAGYTDSHMDVILESVNARRNQLENEMQLQYNVYTQMAAQAKQAEAKIQERTPAFTIIQNAYMPIKPSSRPKIVTLMIFMFLGFVLDAIYVLMGKKLWNTFKHRNEEKYI